jgi:outer membrane protein assembly factor BamB
LQLERGQARAERQEERPTSTSKLALPFKRTWEYLTDEATLLPPSFDGNRLFLPMAGGRAVCLDRETGLLLWSSDLGGSISVPIAVGKAAIYLATRRVSDDGSEAGASLRAIDKTTGLTIWARDYSRAFTSAFEITSGQLFAGSADGFFYALSISNGETLWRVQTQDVVRGTPLIVKEVVYFGSDDGTLRGVRAESGKQQFSYQTSGKVVGRPLVESDSIYFGSGDGYVYSVALSTGKLRWRSRTGASIETSPVASGDRLIVGSFDNFVYGFKRSSGDRVWKRRLSSRVVSDLIVEGDAVLVAPQRGDYVAVLLVADGRQVNYFRLDGDYEMVASPLYLDGILIIPTDSGLVAAVASKLPDPPSAAKK